MIATTFDHKAFVADARHFKAFGEQYAAIGLDSGQAAKWANRGFLPEEAADWIVMFFGPDEAARHANNGRTPAQAVEYDNDPPKPDVHAYF